MNGGGWHPSHEVSGALGEVIATHGPGALSDTRLLGNLLDDLLPDAPQERRLILLAAEADVPRMLERQIGSGLDAHAAVQLATASLARQQPLSPPVCRWVVTEIARALGHPLVTEETVPPPYYPPAVAGGAALGDLPTLDRSEALRTVERRRARSRALPVAAAMLAIVVLGVVVALIALRRPGSSNRAVIAPPSPATSAGGSGTTSAQTSTNLGPGKSMSTSSSTTAPAVAAVGVNSCTSEYGVSPPPPVPQAPTSVEVPSALATQLSGYSNGFITLVGPTGWACSGLVAGDGGLSLTVYPVGDADAEAQGPAASVPAIYADIPSAQTGPAAQLACPLFPSAASFSGVPCTSRPEGESVYQASSSTVDFEDPPGVTGDGDPSGGPYPANGVAIWDQTSQFAAEGTCALPEEQHTVCTAVLNDFQERYRSGR